MEILHSIGSGVSNVKIMQLYFLTKFNAAKRRLKCLKNSFWSDKETCPNCFGDGNYFVYGGMKTCENCFGTGLLSERVVRISRMKKLSTELHLFFHNGIGSKDTAAKEIHELNHLIHQL